MRDRYHPSLLRAIGALVSIGGHTQEADTAAAARVLRAVYTKTCRPLVFLQTRATLPEKIGVVGPEQGGNSQATYPLIG